MTGEQRSRFEKWHHDSGEYPISVLNAIFAEGQYELKEGVDTESAVDAVLGSLPGQERQIMLGFFKDHLTYDQMMERLGVTPDQCLSIEYQALRDLRHPSRSRKLHVLFKPVGPDAET